MKYLKKYNESHESDTFKSEIKTALQELVDDGYAKKKGYFAGKSVNKVIYDIIVPTKNLREFFEILDMAIYKIKLLCNDDIVLRCWDIAPTTTFGSQSISGSMYNATCNNKYQKEINNLSKSKNQFEIIKNYILNNKLKDLSFKIELTVNDKKSKTNESLDYIDKRYELLDKLEKEYKEKIDECILYLSDEYKVDFTELDYDEDFERATFKYNVIIDNQTISKLSQTNDIDIIDEYLKELRENIDRSKSKLEVELNADTYIYLEIKRGENGERLYLIDGILGENDNTLDIFYSDEFKKHLLSKNAMIVIKLEIE